MAEESKSASSSAVTVGLVGYGMSAKVFHGPLIAAVPKLFRVTHIVKRSGSVSAGDAEVVRSLEELLATDVQLVVVCTPSGVHFEQTKQILEAGKHVVVEKPFTVTTKEANALVTLADSKGLVLSVFHNRRFDSDFMTVKALIDSGSLGDLAEFESHFDRYRPNVRDRWREKAGAGAGMVYDLGSHVIDQAVQLFGEPSGVRADVRRQRPGATTDDYFDIDLRYDDRPGLKVTLKAGMVVRDVGPRFVLHGSKGSYKKMGLDVQEGQLKAGMRLDTHPDTFGVEPESLHGCLVADVGGLEVTGTVKSRRGNYGQYYRDVHSAITGTASATFVSGAQAATTIRIIEAAFESSAAGGARVSL